ncbi:hypothetical protein AX16_003647 [Volvariella volvacea WC 439]|nr:hypothetical protein AX16_003647 [Volvariella volvacea WC 439]
MLASALKRLATSTPRGLQSLRFLSAEASPSHTAQQTSQEVNYPYFVARNSRGNLPVYTDIRNGGTRYMVLIRNVDGRAHTLAEELAKTLFESSSAEAARMKVKVVQSRHLVITGGRWKHQVMEWLARRGF